MRVTKRMESPTGYTLGWAGGPKQPRRERGAREQADQQQRHFPKTFQYSTQLLQLPLHAPHQRAPLQPGDSRQRYDRHSDRNQKLKLQHLPNYIHSILVSDARLRQGNYTPQTPCPARQCSAPVWNVILRVGVLVGSTRTPWGAAPLCARSWLVQLSTNMEPPDAVNPPPSVRRDALPRRRAADARHADAGNELWRIVLLGTLPIALALPLPGAAALAITSLSRPSPPSGRAYSVIPV